MDLNQKITIMAQVAALMQVTQMAAVLLVVQVEASVHPITVAMEAAGIWERVLLKVILPVHRKVIQLVLENPTVKVLDLLMVHHRDYLTQTEKEPVPVTVLERVTVLLQVMDPVRVTVMEKVQAILPARTWVSPILYPSVKIKEPACHPLCRSL